MTEARRLGDTTPVAGGHDVCAALRRYGRAVAHEVCLSGQPKKTGALSPTRAAADARLEDSLRQLAEPPHRGVRPICRASLGYAGSQSGDQGRGDS